MIQKDDLPKIVEYLMRFDTSYTGRDGWADVMKKYALRILELRKIILTKHTSAKAEGLENLLALVSELKSKGALWRQVFEN